MSYSRKTIPFILIGCFIVFLWSCQNFEEPKVKDIVKPERKLSDRISDRLLDLMEHANNNGGRINDSTTLRYTDLADSIYFQNKFQPIWSRGDRWLVLSDSLLEFIGNAKNYGLFPSDYHYSSLAFIKRILQADTLAKKNDQLWARADVLFTDAFFSLVKDIKQGRLPFDSVTLRVDTVLQKNLFLSTLSDAIQNGSVAMALQKLEPKYLGYDSLRTYTMNFLTKAKFVPYTYLVYPYKDSVTFFHSLEKRLHELNLLPPNANDLDSNAFKAVIRKFQNAHNFKPTGHVNDALIDHFNNTDWEKFKRIAVNLDRYKLLPDTLPQTYVWVNIPSYTLQVIDSDTIVFQSRIIVGGPQTRTPLLTSEISNFITYPQWTVPFSIIFKEMLPKIRQNVEFLDKENLMVVDKNDSVVDPRTINWYKLNKSHFPYLLKQRQGDDNSLGVIKFNFRNKYSVYMHDTNVRWLFGKSNRALSHGCVRVKEWQKLADYLIRTDTVKLHPDTLRAWIARQEKHIISGFPKLPVYIRYFTCEARDGSIRFYDDIYEEDRYLCEKYFMNKTVE
ncbi:MAG: hypothetical protein C5B59_18905 [Bacteroidetes bacterium]|nr:MAG: hypothetical protein C5B59_18905 [Bacteroidota bacterium]